MSNGLTNLTPASVALLTDAELNQACAERVMGWEARPDKTSDRGFSYYDAQGELREDGTYWKPATQIDDAARCTEKMLAKGFTLMLTSPGSPGHKSIYVGHWWAVMYRSSDELAAETHAATEPRARAEACLRAAMREDAL